MTRIKPVFTFDASATSLTYSIMENGFVDLMAVVVPNFTNAVTVTVTVKDVDGIQLWSKASIPKNSTTVFGNGPDAQDMGQIPIDYGYTITITLSGAAGGTGGSVQVAMYCNHMGVGE